MYAPRCRNSTTYVSFFVRKKELLGGRRPPKDILAGQRQAQDAWVGLRPPKSSFFLTEKDIETARKK